MENQNSATLENHFEEIWKSMKEIIQETRKELQNSINEAFKPIMEKLGDLKYSNEIALNIIQELKITLPDDEVDVLDFGEEEYNHIPLHNQAEELPKQAKGNFLPVIEFFSPFLERNLIVGKFYTKQNESSMADKVYDEMPRRVFNSSNTEKGGSVYVIMNQFSPKYDDSGGREADIQVTGAGTHGELFNICDRNKEYNSSTMSTIRKNTFISVIRYANWDTRVNNFPSAFMSSSIVADVFQESASSKAYGSEQIQLLTDHRSKMVTIQSVKVRQIFHNRGNPTVEVDVGLSDGTWSKDAVPSGASTRIYEARELRDGGSNYLGKDVLKAVGNVNTIIGPALIGKDPTDQTGIDDYMVQQLDGTINEWGWCKQKLGANAMLAVSIAVCKAGASVLNIPLCKQIANLAGNKKLVLPVLAFNVINGGSQAGNKLVMLEFMILPVGTPTFKEAVKMGVEVYRNLKSVIKKKYDQDAINVSDEGGFAPNIQENKEGMELLKTVIAKAGYISKVVSGMDVAVSEFYGTKTYDLKFKEENNNGSQKISGNKLKELYKIFVTEYPILSIENPFDQDEWEHYGKMKGEMGEKVQIMEYYLLLHNQFGIQCSHHNNELLGCLPEEYRDRPEVYLRSPPQFQTNWALGFKSTTSPHETMIDVLKVFESLNVRWKKIGLYNMKCIWLPQLSTYYRLTSINGNPHIKDICDNEFIITSLSRMAVKSHDVAKFEIQLYKASPQLYVLDLQRICGQPFLFLEIRAAVLGTYEFSPAATDDMKSLVLIFDPGGDVVTEFIEGLMETYHGLQYLDGLAGTKLIHKVAGSAAASVLFLADVAAEAKLASEMVGTMGVALSVCTLPGQVTSDCLGPGKMELGPGIHGEPGAVVTDVQPVDVLVSHVHNQILSLETNYVPIKRGNRVVLMINGLGGAPVMKLMITAGKVIPRLQLEHGLTVDRVYTGPFIIFLDMSEFLKSAYQTMFQCLDVATEASHWPVGVDGNHPPAKIHVPVPPSRSTTTDETLNKLLQLNQQGHILEMTIEVAASVVINLKDNLNKWDSKVGDGECGV